VRRNLAGEPRPIVRVSLEAAPEGVRPAVAPLALFALLKAAQIPGALARVLDIAMGYSNERVQFGRPIAKFQAVQHMLAEAAGHVAAAGVAVDLAAAEPGEALCAAAKARASEAAGRVAALTHQVIGAIGYAREYHLHPLTRRLWSWRDEAGDETFWHAVLARHALSSGAADDLWAWLTHGLRRNR
jgi:acyl-CoA dehydrogenase